MTWTVWLLVDPLGALAVRSALVIVMTSRRAVLAQDLVATSLVLYPRRVAAVWRLKVQQGPMQCLTNGLLLLLDQEVVKQERVIYSRLLL